MMVPALAALAAPVAARSTPGRPPRITSLRVLPFYPPTGEFGPDLFGPSVRGKNPELYQPIDVHVMAVLVGVYLPPDSNVAAPKVHLVVTTGGYEPGEKTAVVLDGTFVLDTVWEKSRANIVTLVRVNGCPSISFKATLVGYGKQKPKEDSIDMRCGPE